MRKSAGAASLAANSGTRCSNRSTKSSARQIRTNPANCGATLPDSNRSTVRFATSAFSANCACVRFFANRNRASLRPSSSSTAASEAWLVIFIIRLF
jgi:hypothetical protein